MLRFFRSFKRVTSSGNYIAELDGLRFLAIMSVVLFHIRGAFIVLHSKLPVKYPQDLQNSVVYRFLDNGNQGVELFFVISGFILALPFINQYRYNGKVQSLKSFYFRRLTRLEPPYIIALILLFIGNLVSHQFTVKELFPSLLASMVYIHSLIYSGLPKITGVLWSLEVEVQFYILTPLLLRIFLLPKYYTRIILVTAMVLMPVFQNMIPVQTNTLFKFFQYFATGILLADIYLDKGSFIFNLKSIVFTLVGVIFLFLLFWMRTYDTATSSTSVGPDVLLLIEKTLYPFYIFFFCAIVLGNPFWKILFSIQTFAIIGGMCYSIYLLHAAIISMFARYCLKVKVTDNALIEFIIVAILFLIPIFIICSIYFKLIEQPCMEKDWYIKLYRKIKGKPATTSA